nr:putative membrane-bound O-acyltransferase C24H6.01c isoform X1 [Tanacetum cinerariifolium]
MFQSTYIGKTCYRTLQERSVGIEKFSYTTYLCYLLYAPLYIAGPIISFNAFASQLDAPQKNYTLKQVAWYGIRWVLSLILMEITTHFFYYNAFAISGIWKQLSPMEVFIVGYGVLNFMWLKFFLIWRYFRFWALVSGIEAPENMPSCINNCYN